MFVRPPSRYPLGFTCFEKTGFDMKAPPSAPFTEKSILFTETHFVDLYEVQGELHCSTSEKLRPRLAGSRTRLLHATPREGRGRNTQCSPASSNRKSRYGHGRNLDTDTALASRRRHATEVTGNKLLPPCHPHGQGGRPCHNVTANVDGDMPPRKLFLSSHKGQRQARSSILRSRPSSGG